MEWGTGFFMPAKIQCQSTAKAEFGHFISTVLSKQATFIYEVQCSPCILQNTEIYRTQIYTNKINIFIQYDRECLAQDENLMNSHY